MADHPEFDGLSNDELDHIAAQQDEANARNRGNGQDAEPPDRGAPPIGAPTRRGPPPDRSPLLLANWLTRKLPPRESILGDVLFTTSRWIIIGDTGIGKTLLALAIAGASASGSGLLDWNGSGKQRRVLYLDGEMPAETFKERMENVAREFGADIELYGYNRDVLDDDDMPPLNTPEGEAWLLAEIAAIKPELIVFDSIMCLLIGVMSEEESWTPIKQLMRKITSMRIAQIWLHHTGHDASRGFGTKTREWQVDTVAILLESDANAVEMRFTKSRLKTPATANQFAPKLIRCDANGWIVIGAAAKGGKNLSQIEIDKHALLDAYDRLADAVAPSPDFQSPDFPSEPVRKIEVDAVRNEMRRRGFLEANNKGNIIHASRMAFLRAKKALIQAYVLVEADGFIWRIKPASSPF